MDEESFDKSTRGCSKRLCGFLLDTLLSQFGLFVIVVCYVIMGGFLFEYLESDYGNIKKSSIVKSRDECLKELWAITERLNVLYEKNWTRLVHAQLRKFESSVVALATSEGADAVEVFENHWSFTSSLLYSLTLITTIGYGSIAPKTVAGRAATIIYAAAGVPLALACLAALGTTLARAAKIGWTKATGRTKSKAWRKESEIENHVQKHDACQLLNHHSHDGNRSHHQYTALSHGPGSAVQQFQRPGRAATLARVRYAMDYDDLPQVDIPQTQTLDRKPMRNIQNSIRAKSRYQPRPMTPEVRQLIVEECGEDAVRLRNEDDLEDSDDVEADRICQHDTPSRVPLLCKSPVENRKATNKGTHQPSIKTTTPECKDNYHNAFDHTPVPISLIIILLSGYMCAGAALFSAWEGWGFLDSLYFCFVTLSTIGFGDLVPNNLVTSKHSESSKSEYIQMLACCTYLFVGLVLIAMSLSLLQDELVAKCNQLTTTWGWTKT